MLKTCICILENNAEFSDDLIQINLMIQKLFMKLNFKIAKNYIITKIFRV